ncbi:mRNA turnover protein 4 homolog [Nilaparvata lugens]|uniref:mRNA turnover protein 4 homolog n=1 Tax=Nilaparvata lugens TaxID=108931 RepID=UPI000B99075A|nr:mRNA turnover protein 4 homolog [Nilaparvata lugens]
MPRSKRDKKISLTKTSKKGLQLKQQLVEQVREAVEKCPNIFVFDVQNMRNSKLKDVRIHWRTSRMFFGKNKIMQLALGKGPEDEIKDNLSKLTAEMKGQCGLLFTSKSVKEVREWFRTFEAEDYSRSGSVASETVHLPEGPLPDFPHSIEPHLRQLGLPTSLQKGVVTLIKDHTVCNVGDVLNPEQAKILKLLGKKLSIFKMKLRCVWSKGEFKKFGSKKAKKEVAAKDNSESNVDVDMAEV